MLSNFVSIGKLLSIHIKDINDNIYIRIGKQKLPSTLHLLKVCILWQRICVKLRAESEQNLLNDTFAYFDFLKILLEH